MRLKLSVLPVGLREFGKEISSPASPRHRTGGACTYLVLALGAGRSAFPDDLHIWQPQGQIAFMPVLFLVQMNL